MNCPSFLIRGVYRLTKRKSLTYRDLDRRLERMGKVEKGAYQLKKLQNLISFVYENNEFYKQLWNERKIDVSIASLEDLNRFPLVSKDMLREAARRGTLISKPYVNHPDNYLNSTTGSSGEPIEVTLNKDCLDERVGSVYAIQEWAGLYVGDHWVSLWRGPLKKSLPEKLKEFLTGRTIISIYDPAFPSESMMNDRRCDVILEHLKSLKPKVIDGFVSALSQIAQYKLTNQVELGFIPQSIITGAEYLPMKDRDLIEQAFGAPVFNRYGGTEFSLLANECEIQSQSDHYLHAIDYRGIIETVGDAGPVNDVEAPLVFTDFSNLAMPLIRYQTGDLAIRDPRPSCACGRNLVLFKEITGRVNDVFVLKGGLKITSHIWHHYMKKCLGIKKYQIIQEAEDKFTVKFVLYPDLNQNEFNHVKELIQKTLNGSQITWNVVDGIPVGPGGKQQQCIRR